MLSPRADNFPHYRTGKDRHSDDFVLLIEMLYFLQVTCSLLENSLEVRDDLGMLK